MLASFSRNIPASSLHVPAGKSTVGKDEPSAGSLPVPGGEGSSKQDVLPDLWQLQVSCLLLTPTDICGGRAGQVKFRGLAWSHCIKMMEYDVMGSPRRGGGSGCAAGIAGGCPARVGGGGRGGCG